uniref:Thioredoxin domain-containing protein n=1 Tax=Bicosoecida sp. CB-2014 TaxID=1486930 RepID=A0A7S1CCP8_9STRA
MAAPRALTLLLLLGAAVAAAAGGGSAAQEQVVAVTDASFGDLSGPTLLAFTAPWCGHCKRLAPTYEAVAKELKGEGVSVGKVDCTAERALAARFGITGFPTIYFLSADGDVVQYSGQRSVESLAAFARGGWREAEALSYWSSPMGPVGRFKGFVIGSLYGARNLHTTVVERYDLSPTVAAVGLAFAGLVAIFLLALAVAWCTVGADPNAQQHAHAHAHAE